MTELVIFPEVDAVSALLQVLDQGLEGQDIQVLG